jgi:polyhydroxyalkanoate synthesis regulator phasin
MSALFEHPAAQTWRVPGVQGEGVFAPFMAMLGAMPMRPPGDAGEIKAWLSLPAFGMMREHQEHYQKMAVAWVDYQEQLRRYNESMLKAAQRGFELFEGKLAEREQPGRQIESLRALYDLWVDAAEEGHAEVALSKEFREAYGELVNAQMRVRSQVQQEIERVSVDFGMPTRTELYSIGERLQALRREVRGRSAGVSDGLADEVAALREEFAKLKASVRNVASAAVKEREVRVEAAPRRSRAEGKRVAAKPASVSVSKKQKRGGKSERKAVARDATQSKNFASRVAKFANASLGASRTQPHRPEKRNGAKKSKKN